MRRCVGIVAPMLALSLLPLSSVHSQVQRDKSFCAERHDASIPARSTSALEGSEMARRLEGIGDDAREALIRNELLSGNIPEFLRRLHPVELRSDLPDGSTTRITLCVMPDYLAVGSDRDYLLVPMQLQTALSVADRFGFMLPTPAIVDAISAQSVVHLAPQPLPASPEMRSTAYYLHHDELIRSQRTELNAARGALTSGDKKDLVLTNRLWTNLDRIAIYGWHTLEGRPIQPLSLVHGWHYVDYSHGVRLVSSRLLLNNRPQSLSAALQSALAARLLSYEGMLSPADLTARLREARILSARAQ